MKNVRLLIFGFVIGISLNFNAQQTVGIFQNSVDSFNGYTLFPPIGSTTTYLIDNCGELSHSWPSSYRPAFSAYLMENGLLLRAGKVNNPDFVRGGSGGIIEMIDMDGNVVWDYIISTSEECQHHDIEYLPNGNILAVVWDLYTASEAEQAGRTTIGDVIWSEKILEIEPDLINGGGTIVWEWKAWDHLVQDENPDKDNFGVVADSPELIDLNFVRNDPLTADWLHINSVDYNHDLDQIVLSVHNFSELWIIDHSTTTVEASGHTGGDYGKGGDLLYRWGNPRTYDQGAESDQVSFFQHDAKWIPEGFQDAGMLMFFNNQAGTLDGVDSSSVNIIDPPIDENGNYIYSGGAFEPTSFHWTYVEDPATDFFAQNISGAERLPNGNTLICEGTTGRFFEVDYGGSKVWEYINPVSATGIIMQGDPAVNNRVFRSERYATNFVGFNDYDLSTQGYIEPGSEDIECQLFISIIEGESHNENIFIYPNPANESINILSNELLERIDLYSISGVLIKKYYPKNLDFLLKVDHLKSGMYIIKAVKKDGGVFSQKIYKEQD